MPQTNFQIKTLEAFKAFTLDFTAQNHLHYARVTAEIRNTLSALSFSANAHPIHIVHDKTYHHDNVEVEFVIPSDTQLDYVPLPTFGTLKVREYKAIKAVTYKHYGSPDTLNDGLDDLQTWLQSQGYKLGDSIRLVYLQGLVGQRLPIEDWVFEIQHPIEKL